MRFSVEIGRNFRTKVNDNSSEEGRIGCRGHWCDIIAVNMHSSAENKTNVIKDFVEKLDSIRDQCSK
jgi:hypothetical protein